MNRSTTEQRKVRVKVVCVLHSGGRTLWVEVDDSVPGQRWLLPPGGGLEFGETLEAAVRREIGEELGIEIATPRLLGHSENIFEFKGQMEHELVFVFAAEAPPGWPTAFDPIIIDDSGGREVAHWLSAAELRQAAQTAEEPPCSGDSPVNESAGHDEREITPAEYPRFYPEGILLLIQDWLAGQS